MTEALLNAPAPVVELPVSDAAPEASVTPPAAPPAPAEPVGSRLQEYIRRGKFSPAVAAQLAGVLNVEGGQPRAAALTAPQPELYILEMAGHSATGCVLGILVLGAVGLGISLAGVIDSYLLGVAGLIFGFILLGVVALAGLNQSPPKPRPPSLRRTPPPTARPTRRQPPAARARAPSSGRWAPAAPRAVPPSTPVPESSPP